MTWDDLQTWCHELSAWIIEMGEVGELKKAYPRGPFPLVADREQDDLEDSKDVLAYITLWMCCKRRTQAPTGLHNRIMLAEPFKGPWQRLYVKLIQALGEKKEPMEMAEIFNLAG